MAGNTEFKKRGRIEFNAKAQRREGRRAIPQRCLCDLCGLRAFALNTLVHAALWLLFGLLFAIGQTAYADDPLYLQPPYDEIVLDESNGRAILRVQPLPFPERRMPAENDRKEDLEFELVDRPGERFAVPWANVADIRFFERLVLAEADAKAKESRFDEAQPFYLFLVA